MLIATKDLLLPTTATGSWPLREELGAAATPVRSADPALQIDISLAPAVV
jgi:hypothetical protein